MSPVLSWSSGIPDYFTLMFYGSSVNWIYLKCNTTYVLLDGQRLELKSTDYDGEVLSSGGVSEKILAAISWEEAAKFRSGRVIEYKICGDVFKASDAFLCEARDLIRSVENWKKKSRPPG